MFLEYFLAAKNNEANNYTIQIFITSCSCINGQTVEKSLTLDVLATIISCVIGGVDWIGLYAWRDVDEGACNFTRIICLVIYYLDVIVLKTLILFKINYLYNNETNCLSALPTTIAKL